MSWWRCVLSFVLLFVYTFARFSSYTKNTYVESSSVVSGGGVRVVLLLYMSYNHSPPLLCLFNPCNRVSALNDTVA